MPSSKRATSLTPSTRLWQREEEWIMTDFEPQVLAFACHYCAYAAADLAGSMRLNYPPNVKVIHLPCTGKIDIIYLLRAFEDGADAVFVAG